MSKIIDYVRRLNPVGERKDILSTLSQLEDELGEYTLPAAETYQELTKGKVPKGAYSKELTRELQKRVSFSGSAIDLIIESLKVLEGNIPTLEREIKKLFGFQFTREGLSFKRVNLLQYVDAASFYVRYARKALMRVISEGSMVAGKGKATPMTWSKAEEAWLADNLFKFASLFTAINRDSATLQKTINSTSDAIVDEETLGTALNSLGPTGTDPMRLSGLFGPTSNPIFSLGKWRAEMAVKRYHVAKEEHQLLQLRLQEWREIESEGMTNPKLQKLIQYTEQRVEKLDYEITKIEEANRWD